MKTYKGKTLVMCEQLFFYLIILGLCFSFCLFGSFYKNVFIVTISASILVSALIMIIMDRVNFIVFDDNEKKLQIGKFYSLPYEDINILRIFRGANNSDILISKNRLIKYKALLRFPNSHLEELKNDFMLRKNEIRMKEYKHLSYSLILIMLVLLIVSYSLFFFSYLKKETLVKLTEFHPEENFPDIQYKQINAMGLSFSIPEYLTDTQEIEDSILLASTNTNDKVLIMKGLTQELFHTKMPSVMKFIFGLKKPYQFYSRIYTDKYGVVPFLFRKIILGDSKIISAQYFTVNDLSVLIIESRKNESLLYRIHVFNKTGNEKELVIWGGHSDEVSQLTVKSLSFQDGKNE